MKITRGTPPKARVAVKGPAEKRRTPPSGPGVRQLHQRKLTQSRVRGGPRQGPAPDRPLRLALVASAILTVGTIFGAAIFHVLLIQSEFRLDGINKEASKEEARYGKLRLDVAQLSAPERIVATAQQRLGMVVPPQVAYLMAPAPPDSAHPGANPDDPAAPSLAGGWAEVKPHLGTRP
jgi:cell division protein FtsL